MREVVAEVMLPIVDARIPKVVGWQALVSNGEGILKELKNPQFRTWVAQLSENEQSTLSECLSYVLGKMQWTGISAASDLVLSCPAIRHWSGCVHVRESEPRVFSSILKDTEGSATFACLTNTCFTIAPWLETCQKTSTPQWQNNISALVTSVCQYQWSGAKYLQQVAQNGLPKGVSYWIGSNDDRRRVTVDTHTTGPTRLIVSDKPMNWKLLRRTWEHYEKSRRSNYIELLERTSMTDKFATEVVIVRQ